MRMYTQKIKECDHEFDCDCVDLAEKGNYLLLPKKFLMYKQSLVEESHRLEIVYFVPKNYLKNILVLLKSQNQPVDFFCLVYPNGRVEQWDIKTATFEKKRNKHTGMIETTFIIRLQSMNRKTIQLKNCRDNRQYYSTIERISC